MLTSFLAGFLSASFAFALFNKREQEEQTEIDGPIGEKFIMMCASCRKLKPHEEIEPNLYECTKCHRHVDLRGHRILGN